MEYVQTREESCETTQTLFSTPTNTDEQGVASGRFKDPADFANVVDSIVEQDEVHDGVELYVCKECFNSVVFG